MQRLPLLLILLAGSALAQDAPKPAFDPVGRWKMYHMDDLSFMARLTADQSAATDFSGGEHGIWRPDGNGIRVMYTDGWDDVLIRDPDGTFSKGGWGPGDDRCGEPANNTPAERILK